MDSYTLTLKILCPAILMTFLIAVFVGILNNEMFRNKVLSNSF